MKYFLYSATSRLSKAGYRVHTVKLYTVKRNIVALVGNGKGTFITPLQVAVNAAVRLGLLPAKAYVMATSQLKLQLECKAHFMEL